MYFNINNEKEMKLWNYLSDEYSKSAFVKKAIEEKMNRELSGEKAPRKIEHIEEPKKEIEEPREEKKIKLNNDDKKSINNLTGGF